MANPTGLLNPCEMPPRSQSRNNTLSTTTYYSFADVTPMPSPALPKALETKAENTRPEPMVRTDSGFAGEDPQIPKAQSRPSTTSRSSLSRESTPATDAETARPERRRKRSSRTHTSRLQSEEPTSPTGSIHSVSSTTPSASTSTPSRRPRNSRSNTERSSRSGHPQSVRSSRNGSYAVTSAQTARQQQIQQQFQYFTFPALEIGSPPGSRAADSASLHQQGGKDEEVHVRPPARLYGSYRDSMPRPVPTSARDTKSIEVTALEVSCAHSPVMASGFLSTSRTPAMHRRLNSSGLESAHAGVKGFVRKLVPDCLVPRELKSSSRGQEGFGEEMREMSTQARGRERSETVDSVTSCGGRTVRKRQRGKGEDGSVRRYHIVWESEEETEKRREAKENRGKGRRGWWRWARSD